MRPAEANPALVPRAAPRTLVPAPVSALLRALLLAALAWPLAGLGAALWPSVSQAAQGRPAPALAIHHEALREVRRIQRLLASEAAHMDHQGPSLAPPAPPGGTTAASRLSEDRILAAYRAANDHIAAAMPALFQRQPDGFIDIAPQVPSAGRAAQADYVTPPTADGGRPAIYWVAVASPAGADAAAIPATLLRTGRPGRHFQTEDRRAAGMPWGAGWSLYAASLGEEMGLYAEPAARHAWRRMELAAAARMAADTGMQGASWTQRRAAAYLAATTGMQQAQAGAIAAQCAAMPGKPGAEGLAYLRIRQLRARSEKA
ncbi:hypothetical protein ASC94_20310 [Massilia sp. Root418]|uniref:DUF885 family protein n=1 Tax=Massilia sp. Root418 TaxID=1736532 RepID=UPI0006F1EC27|nr:DUF885 family protein [Massilia sp. Root418]KQW90090.1 hypothetical protein ASC94_20310 [Massilia sp. Root418]